MVRKKAKVFILLLFAGMMFSSFTLNHNSPGFSPLGTWEYSVPGVEAGYEKGSMIIEKDGKNYKVTMVLNEYSKTEAEKVMYKRKNMSFTIWVEGEEILVSGAFDKDQFTGTISYSEGDFRITAARAS